MWPKRKTELERKNEALDKELAGFRLKSSVEGKERLVLELKEREQYRSGDTAVRSRIEARREARNPKRQQQQARVASHVMAGFDDSEGLQLCASAVQQDRPSVSPQQIKSRIGESITENLGFMPFSYDYLTTAFKSLYQVQGLIREMYPYKSTIIRYIQTLDFARWACRVLYSECPTAMGLIRAKTNFIIRRGNKVSIKPRKNVEAKEKQRPLSIGEGEAADSSDDPAAQASDKQSVSSKTPEQRQAEWYVDRFLDENEFAEKERERYRRECMDGEAFGWTANPEKPPAETKDGVGACEYAYIEPDYIRPSQKKFQSQEDPSMVGGDGKDWSFGILTPHHRYYKPIAYNVVWNDNEEQVIPADRMVHAAVRERSNMKRCLPPLLLSADDIIRMTLLRSALADASRYRASIAGVIQYQEASMGPIEGDDDGIYGTSLDSCGTSGEGYGRFDRLESQGGANVLELTRDRLWVDGPLFPPGDSLTMVYDWHIRAIAQQWGVPEWLVKGASAGSSFADSLTAESPSIVEFESEQARECRFTRRSVLRELQYRIEVGHLPADFLENYDVDVQSDSVITRDSKAEMETAVMSFTNGFSSKRTSRIQLGLDPDFEESQCEQEEESGQGPQQPEDTQDEEMQGGPKTTGGKQTELQK